MFFGRLLGAHESDSPKWSRTSCDTNSRALCSYTLQLPRNCSCIERCFPEVADKSLVKPEIHCKLQKLHEITRFERTGVFFFGPSHYLLIALSMHILLPSFMWIPSHFVVSRFTHDSFLVRYEIMDGFCNPNGYSSTLCSLQSNITPMEVEGVFGTEMLFLMSPCLGFFGVHHLGFS